MNFTSPDFNTKLLQSFNRLHPSVLSPLSNAHIHHTLVLIGFITVCLLLLTLIFQFLLKVRQIYRTSEPNERSSKRKLRYPSYQNLLDTDHNQCQCLRKFSCLQPSSQILNQSPYYEQIDERQIDERQINRSISRIYPSRHSSYIAVHTVK